jgi:quinol monooxygenase YgiN
MSTFGLYGKITIQPEQRDALAAILLEAADLLQDDEACRLYVVSMSPIEPDVLWVTEVWTSQAAHSASLQREDVRALIAQGMPLITGGERIEIVPLGGKGIALK